MDADVVKDTQNDANPRVCKIHSIHGPLSKKAGGRKAQDDMIDFLLGGDSDDYAAGHVIAASLGGPDTTLNLVPMAHKFNNGGGWKSMELRLLKCVSDPNVKTISMNVALKYPSSAKKKFVSKSIKVTLTVNGHKKKTINFPDTSKEDSQNFAGKACTTSWV